MIVNNITLKNDLKVCLIPDKNSGVITIHLKGLAGSNFENINQVGAAHILEHFYTSSNYGNKIVTNGGKIIGVTSRDDVLFMVKVSKTGLLDGLDFLSKVFAKEPISKYDFDKLRNISLLEIKRILSNPEKFLGRVSPSASFSEERMSKLNIGEEKYLSKLTIKDVLDFRDLHYHPNNFVLVLSGNIPITTVLPYIKKFFGEYDQGPVAEQVSHRQNKELVIKNYDYKLLPQHLVKIDFYGYKISDDKKYPSLVISNILDSLLNRLIKERLGLSYVLKCVLSSSGSYGLFSIYFSCDKNKTATILGEVNNTLNNFSTLISTRSVQNSKTRVISNLGFEMEKVSVRAEFHSNLILHGRKDQDYQYEVKKIKDVSLNDIRNASLEIFSQKPKITIIGDDVPINKLKNIFLK